MGGGNSKPKEEAGSFPATVANADEANNVKQEKTSTTTTTTTTTTTAESKCPMHRNDGTYSYSWSEMWKAASVHGPGGVKPLSQEQQQLQVKELPVAAESSSGCPVKHNSAPMESSGGCPVKHNGGPASSLHPEYNVYSQPIDKTNQMPKGVRTQMPTSTQTVEISTERVKSTIPKGGDTEADATWTYPSPQQFYNALARKGKLGDDTSEHDMETVVALHNNMNEKTWAQVQEWERQTYNATSTPKLLKFQGRPHDLSPKATLKHYLLGHPLPYDRHDWTILRDDGSTVRYVIDYYYDETRARDTPDSSKPLLHDRQATPSLLVDVRPALDGPSQFVSRAFKMPYKLMTKQTVFEPLPLRGTPEMSSQVQESIKVWESIQQARKQEQKAEQEDEEGSWEMQISENDAKKIALNFSNALTACREQQGRVDSCQTEDECSKASLDLTMCMGPMLCPVQHQTLMKTLTDDDEDKIEAALETLTECVVLQTAKRSMAKKQHPTLF